MESGETYIIQLQECLKSFGWCDAVAEEVYGTYMQKSKLC